MSMKAKDEFSGLAGPRPGHHHPSHVGMEVGGDGSSHKLPKCHPVGSKEKKHEGEPAMRCALLQAWAGPQGFFVGDVGP